MYHTAAGIAVFWGGQGSVWGAGYARKEMTIAADSCNKSLMLTGEKKGKRGETVLGKCLNFRLLGMGKRLP